MRKMSFLDEVLQSAARFHGHLGPFLALGVRAGLRAIEVFGYRPFEMKAEIATHMRTPYTCFVDGVQFVTGCTMGKGNIKLVHGAGIKAVFTVGSKRLELTVKEEALEKAKNAGERSEEVALKIMRGSLEELFEEKLI